MRTFAAKRFLPGKGDHIELRPVEPLCKSSGRCIRAVLQSSRPAAQEKRRPAGRQSKYHSDNRFRSTANPPAKQSARRLGVRFDDKRRSTQTNSDDEGDGEERNPHRLASYAFRGESRERNTPAPFPFHSMFGESGGGTGVQYHLCKSARICREI